MNYLYVVDPCKLCGANEERFIRMEDGTICYCKICENLKYESHWITTTNSTSSEYTTIRMGA